MADLSKPFKIACAIDNDACYDLIEKGQRRMFIRGKASGTQIDRDHERVAESAILSIQKAIEEGIISEDGDLINVPLMSEHEQGWDDHLGVLVKAWVDDNWDLWIEAELDADNPRSHYLYSRLKKSGPHQKKLGLSIGGRVLEAGYEYVPELEKSIRVFYDVGLSEVSVTSRPAYPTAYLNALNKSVAWDGVRAERQVVVGEEIYKSYRHRENDMSEKIIEKYEEVVEEVEKTEAETEQVTQEAEVEVAKAEDTAADEAHVEKAEDADEDVAAEDEAEPCCDEPTDDCCDKQQTEDAVEKSEEDAEEDADDIEKSEADPLDEIRTLITTLTSEVETIKSVLKSVNVTPTEDAVEKAEDDAAETQDEPVEKTEAVDESAEVVEKADATEPSEDVIAKALNDTLGALLDEKLAPVAETLEGLEKRLTEVENAEVDGSISVSKAIGNSPDDVDPYEELKKEMDELPTAADRLAFLLKRQAAK